MTMMADQDNAAKDVGEQIRVPLSRLCTYVDGKGRPKPVATKLLQTRLKAWSEVAVLSKAS